MAFEDAFKHFVGMLSQASLSGEVIDLAEESLTDCVVLN
jgi:hypothetical protein